ncbi:hypothetical protein RBB50_012514 [Rhinocladiella similis]
MNSPNQFLQAIERIKTRASLATEFSYNERDVILYNISVGATSTQLPLIFEQHPEFQVLPTFGAIVPHSTPRGFDMSDIIPNFSYQMLLHGEQYLEIRKWPIPTSSVVVSQQQLVDVIDKGNAAIVVISARSWDAQTNEDLFYNESTLFIRNSGGFNGPRVSKRPPEKPTAVYSPPNRVPDVVCEETTSKDQAAIYRLNGDRNPLHIDPAVASAAGFQEGPILHGLCTFAITGKCIYQTYGRFKNIKVRFTGTTQPGQTLQVEMWSYGTMIIFQTRVKETGKLCISGGGAEIVGVDGKL